MGKINIEIFLKKKKNQKKNMDNIDKANLTKKQILCFYKDVT